MNEWMNHESMNGLKGYAAGSAQGNEIGMMELFSPLSG